MKNKKLLIIVVVLLVLITSFLLFVLKPNAKKKKLKELNYNVTYKEAFPDYYLRRGVLLCIMRNRCGEDQANHIAYNYDEIKKEKYIWNSRYYEDYYQTNNWLNNTNFGSIITKEELEAKENEKIDKEALERLKVLIAYKYLFASIDTLQGIEYLPNIKVLMLNHVENVDLSTNKKLEKVFLRVRGSSINLDENIKIKELILKFSEKSQNINLSHLSSLEALSLRDSHLNNITLPSSIKKLDLNGNNIKKLDLSNNLNIEKLILNNNPLENLNISMLSNLKVINISANSIPDLTKNLNLEEISIEGWNSPMEDIRPNIGEVDFNKNVNLKKLEITSSKIKNINLNKNINLEELTLRNNAINTLDLSKNINLKNLTLENNEIKNISIPNSVTKSNSIDKLNVNIKRDTYQEISLTYNGQKIYLNPNSSFTREGDNYKFKNFGTYNLTAISPDSKFTWNFIVKVTPKDTDLEVDKFYRPSIEDEIDANELRKQVVNLPKNVKKFEIIDPLPTKYFVHGKYIIKVRLTFDDGSTKEYDLYLKIYNKPARYLPVEEYEISYSNGMYGFFSGGGRLEPKDKYYLSFTLDERYSKIMEGSKIDFTRRIQHEGECVYYGQDDRYNDVYDLDCKSDFTLKSKYTNVPNGIKINDNGFSGVIDYIWYDNEEEHVFEIKYEENGHIYFLNETFKYILLRDTDKDGIPDKDDDDKDGDGYSNEEELTKGSDPYDKTSVPNGVNQGEAGKFIPIIDQKDYKPIICEDISEENLKKIVTNLPNNIKKFEVIKPIFNKYCEKGKKSIKVEVTFNDNTKKKFYVDVNIYDVEYEKSTIEIKDNNQKVLDGKEVNIDILRKHEEAADDTELIKYKEAELIGYRFYDKANGLTYSSNKISGKIDYNFIGDEEEHEFIIKYVPEYNYNFSNTEEEIRVTLLRDTDKDGIPDKDDDDKDGDGFSNAVEIARGSDPYDKASIPDISKKEEVDNLVTKLENNIRFYKAGNFNTKNKLHVNNFKLNFLPQKERELNNIKDSYDITTNEVELNNKKIKLKEEIKSINEELNEIKDKANFEELNKVISSQVEELYTKESLEPLKLKIKEAKELDKDSATQKEVDDMTFDIIYLIYDLKLNLTELKEKIEELETSIEKGICIDESCKSALKEVKEIYERGGICKYNSMTLEDNNYVINIIDNLLKNKKDGLVNPKTGIKTYSLVILFIIFISYLVFKKKKSYIR